MTDPTLVEASTIAAGDILFDQLYQKIDTCPSQDGISQIDILNLPAPLVAPFNRITRQRKISEPDFAAELGISHPQMQRLGQLLVEKGYLTRQQVDEETIYQINFAQRHTRCQPVTVWDKLDL